MKIIKSMKLLIFMLVMGLSGAGGAYAQQMTVEQAYAAIPHSRTPFDPAQSLLKPEEARYLSHLFFVTDMATVSRIVTLKEFLETEPEALLAYNEDIDSLLGSFEHVKTPEKLKELQATVIAAIQKQQEFFKDWATAAGTPEFDTISRAYTSNRHVEEAHEQLLDAADLLKKLYPGESLHNKQAFYDHLGALDFL